MTTIAADAQQLADHFHVPWVIFPAPDQFRCLPEFAGRRDWVALVEPRTGEVEG